MQKSVRLDANKGAALESKLTIAIKFADATKPKIPLRDDGYHTVSCQLSLLNQAFSFGLCTHSQRLTCHLTVMLHRMNRSRAVYFSQEGQIVLMKVHDEYKEIITAKGSTVAANKARKLLIDSIHSNMTAAH